LLPDDTIAPIITSMKKKRSTDEMIIPVITARTVFRKVFIKT
jgi:hypothetical protein